MQYRLISCNTMTGWLSYFIIYLFNLIRNWYIIVNTVYSVKWLLLKVSDNDIVWEGWPLYYYYNAMILCGCQCYYNDYLYLYSIHYWNDYCLIIIYDGWQYYYYLNYSSIIGCVSMTLSIQCIVFVLFNTIGYSNTYE